MSISIKSCYSTKHSCYYTVIPLWSENKTRLGKTLISFSFPFQAVYIRYKHFYSFKKHIPSKKKKKRHWNVIFFNVFITFTEWIAQFLLRTPAGEQFDSDKKSEHSQLNSHSSKRGLSALCWYLIPEGEEKLRGTKAGNRKGENPYRLLSFHIFPQAGGRSLLPPLQEHATMAHHLCKEGGPAVTRAWFTWQHRYWRRLCKAIPVSLDEDEEWGIAVSHSCTHLMRGHCGFAEALGWKASGTQLGPDSGLFTLLQTGKH